MGRSDQENAEAHNAELADDTVVVDIGEATLDDLRNRALAIAHGDPLHAAGLMLSLSFALALVDAELTIGELRARVAVALKNAERGLKGIPS